MSKSCAIVGIGQTHHSAAREDLSIAGLVREAAIRALDDAGLGWEDIDALIIGKAPDFFEGVMMPELFLADALGAAGKPMLRVHTAGSVGGVDGPGCGKGPSRPASIARSLTVAFEKQSESETTWALTPKLPFTVPMVAGAGGYFAPIIRSYMTRSGAPEHIGMKVAVKDRLNALKKPVCASAHGGTSRSRWSRSPPMLWNPLRYLETCPASDGACAMVLTSDDKRHLRGEDQAGLGARGPPCAVSRRCSRAAIRSIRWPVRSASRVSTGKPASRIPARRSTWPRSTSPSAGMSRCGWRTSASRISMTVGR